MCWLEPEAQTKGGASSVAGPRKAAVAPMTGVADAAPAPAPAALVQAVEETMQNRGAGISNMQATMEQMQAMMASCAQLMKEMQAEREAAEPGRKAQKLPASAGPQ